MNSNESTEEIAEGSTCLIAKKEGGVEEFMSAM